MKDGATFAAVLFYGSARIIQSKQQTSAAQLPTRSGGERCFFA
jgi:hypothetical protein